MRLFNNNICIVEGFDMVGKSFFMKNFMPEFSIYHANHDLTDQTIGRHNSWAIGYGIIDFLSQTGIGKTKVVIDRGVGSSYVYKMLYEGSSDLISEVVKWYSEDEFFKESVGHIHVCHYNRASAKVIYAKSQSREENPNKISAQFDKFLSFDEYWEFYEVAEDLFKSVYEKLGIKPIVVKSFNGGYVINYPDGAQITVEVGSK